MAEECQIHTGSSSPISTESGNSLIGAADPGRSGGGGAVVDGKTCRGCRAIRLPGDKTGLCGLRPVPHDPYGSELRGVMLVVDLDARFECWLPKEPAR